LILRVGSAPNPVKPDFQRVRTRWIRGFIAFRQLRRTRIVMLIVLE
jgi:hypothetical protein